MAQDVDATHWKHYPNDIKFSFFTFYILAGILVTSGNNQVNICVE